MAELKIRGMAGSAVAQSHSLCSRPAHLHNELSEEQYPFQAVILISFDMRWNLFLHRDEMRLKTKSRIKKKLMKHAAYLRFLIRSKWFKLQERGYKQGDFRAC